MRIWDVEPKLLCRNHLLGEHRELHALWSIVINKKKGFSRHPETLRWVGKLRALYSRHGELVEEMKRRGYNHRTPLDRKYARGRKNQDLLLQSVPEQKRILKQRPCQCFRK